MDLEDEVLLDEVEVFFVLFREHDLAIGRGELKDVGWL
jgi:hypothetical protein